MLKLNPVIKTKYKGNRNYKIYRCVSFLLGSDNSRYIYQTYRELRRGGVMRRSPRSRKANILGSGSFVGGRYNIYLRTGDDLQGKYKLEKFAELVGVQIQNYRADNDIFNSKTYLDGCKEQTHNMTFCGVRAHFQNDVAKRSIHDVVTWARTLIIDSIIH